MSFMYNLVYYSLVAAVLIAAMLFYLNIANKFNIIDKPNERSSHSYITVRGGGIIFWISAFIFSLLHLPESLYFLIGITLISIVSFWDDVSSLPNRIRIVVHFIAISFLFHEMFRTLSAWQTVFAFIFFVGVLNAYNFMDGINGITGLYSLVVLTALQYVNLQIAHFITPDFITYAIIACIVFLFFNYRTRAKCFAGDIGSMAISFWIVALIIRLIIGSGSPIWVLFLLVYGVDSICTILHRIYSRQNIFRAHRLHFYQILTNERGLSHLTVSAGYALAQLIVCAIIIVAYQWGYPAKWLVGICLMVLCSLLYLLKFALMKKKVSIPKTASANELTQ